jgi:hypothetical protein
MLFLGRIFDQIRRMDDDGEPCLVAGRRYTANSKLQIVFIEPLRKAPVIPKSELPALSLFLSRLFGVHNTGLITAAVRDSKLR